MKEKGIYLDDEHNIVPKEKAKWLVVHIYNKEGKLVEEKWVNLKQSS